MEYDCQVATGINLTESWIFLVNGYIATCLSLKIDHYFFTWKPLLLVLTVAFNQTSFNLYWVNIIASSTYNLKLHILVDTLQLLVSLHMYIRHWRKKNIITNRHVFEVLVDSVALGNIYEYLWILLGLFRRYWRVIWSRISHL